MEVFGTWDRLRSPGRQAYRQAGPWPVGGLSISDAPASGSVDLETILSCRRGKLASPPVFVCYLIILCWYGPFDVRSGFLSGLHQGLQYNVYHFYLSGGFGVPRQVYVRRVEWMPPSE